MGLKHEFRRMLWKIGYDITRFNPASNSFARRRKLLESYGIDVILDVGANTGQFAQQMRTDLGYSGRIVSFEPLSSEFEQLSKNAKRDQKWEVINCGLGEADSTMEINIAGNSGSSSLLKMLPAHIKAAPESGYVARELIKIKSLDSIIDNLCMKNDNIYLKIDTQGYESKVIKGAEASLARIGSIHLEMSLTPLYEEEMLFGEMHTLLSEKGYCLVSIETGFSNPITGQLLQVDGIYHRN
jgi:FkbM family methyltransferase